MNWQPAINLDALLDAQPHALTLGGIDLVLIRRGADVAAIANRCSHANVALAGGTVCDGLIECPAHGARFDIATGAARGLPATRPIATYPVKIEGSRVYVALPE